MWPATKPMHTAVSDSPSLGGCGWDRITHNTTQGLKLAFSVTLRFSRPAHSCKSTPGDPQEAQSLCLTF